MHASMVFEDKSAITIEDELESETCLHESLINRDSCPRTHHNGNAPCETCQVCPSSPKWDLKIFYKNCIRFVVPFGGGAPRSGRRGLKWTPNLFARNSCQRIFSAGVMSRRLSPFSFFENGEMSEGQRGRVEVFLL